MFVADLHNDLVQRMMIGEDVTQNTSSGHTDIERLKLSSIDLEAVSYTHLTLPTKRIV